MSVTEYVKEFEEYRNSICRRISKIPRLKGGEEIIFGLKNINLQHFITKMNELQKLMALTKKLR